MISLLLYSDMSTVSNWEWSDINDIVGKDRDHWTAHTFYRSQGPNSTELSLPRTNPFDVIMSVDSWKGNRESYWGCWSHHSWISNWIQKEFESSFTRNGSDIAIQSTGSWLEFYAAQQPWRFCKVSFTLHYTMATYRSEPVETAFFVVSPRPILTASSPTGGYIK